MTKDQLIQQRYELDRQAGNWAEWWGKQAVNLGVSLKALSEWQSEWSQATFGSDKDRGPIGPLKHLAKEVQEALAAEEAGKSDATEYADCFLLLLDAWRRSGRSIEHLLAVTHDKMKINASREWPKPTSATEPVEHIKQPAL